jgi:hypothetical protein
VLSIDTHEHNVTIPILKLAKAVLESEDFGWADEAEGGGNEEEDKPLGFARGDVAAERFF